MSFISLIFLFASVGMKEALIIGAKFFYFPVSGGEEELFVLKESSERGEHGPNN